MRSIWVLSGRTLRADRQNGEAAARPARTAARRRSCSRWRGDRAVVFLGLLGAAAATPADASSASSWRQTRGLAAAGDGKQGDQRERAAAIAAGCASALCPARLIASLRPGVGLPVNSAASTLPPAKLTFALRYGRFAAGACARAFTPIGMVACALCAASTTASAVMLTTPREVTDGVRMCAGLSVPSRIGPTCSASIMVLAMVSAMLAESRFGNTSRLASPFRSRMRIDALAQMLRQRGIAVHLAVA